MNKYGNKKILGLGAVLALVANVAMATGSHHHQSNNCNDNDSSTPSVCDSWADSEIYDMYLESSNSSNVDSGYSTSGSTVVVDGVGIEVSAWSDTAGSGDDIVVGGYLAGPWSNGTEVGYGMENQDEVDYGNYQNGGYSHAIDNLAGNTTDYDMVLFSFSESVSLTGATFSWLTKESDQEVTVVGLNDISGLTSGSSSWADIINSAVVSAGSFVIEKCDDVYTSTFTTTSTAQYWLVGAYNSAFAYVDSFTKNDDAFKLATIGFTKEETSGKPPTDVNAPGSLALLMLGGGFIAWRKRKSK